MQLVEASAAQQARRDEVTFDAWGSGLTRPQFLAREQVLRAHPWAQRCLRSWWWVDDRGAPLSSCETFTDDAQLGTAAGHAVTIASVYTEPALRGRGHAEAMLRALAPRLAAQGLLALTLYSEIGVKLYARVGFVAAPGVDTLLPAATPRPLVTWHEQALPLPRAQAPAPHTLQLALSAERLDWQLERERFYAAALGHPPLTVHGASVGDASISWTAYWKTKELQVLHLDPGATPQVVPTLLAAAQHAASRAGLPVVRVWETTPLPPMPGARRVPRDDEIPMFAAGAQPVAAWAAVHRGLWA